jgi:molecular chaperone GrpE
MMQEQENMAQEQEKNKTKNDSENEPANAAENSAENLTAEELAENKAKEELGALKNEVGELKDKYLRLYSEFDNFRRRTSKERIDLLKTANEEVIASLIPVLDDFERALKAVNESADGSQLKEGVNLIHAKLYRTLEAKGLKPMDVLGKEFDSEQMEAITTSPAPTEDQKNKVIDVLEKGYYLNDKVIRFAKVVIGS